MNFDFKYKETADVIQTAQEAGEKVLELYNTETKSYEKEDKSLVTDADIAAEKIILNNLKKYGYGILSEETADDLSRLEEEMVWIIDPIDGTSHFIDKGGDFCIMIGLARKDKPIVGVVYQPTEDKLYFAEKGNGSYLYEKGEIRKLSVSSVSEVEEARFVFSRSHLGEEEESFIKENNITKKLFSGSVGIKMGLIAENKADCYVFSGKTNQWDTCAPEIILKEAGGEVADLKGDSFVYNREEARNLSGVLATNGKVHNKIISRI